VTFFIEFAGRQVHRAPYVRMGGPDMIGLRLLIWIGLGCMTWAGPVSAQQLNADQINLIKQTAADLCNTVKEARGQKSESEIKGDIQAKLNGLAGRLVDLSAGGQGSIKSQQFEGLTQDATAIAMQGDRECRERLFNRMFDKLGLNQAPAQPAYDPKPDIKTLGKYLNTKDTAVRIPGDSIAITPKNSTGSSYQVRLFDIDNVINYFHCSEVMVLHPPAWMELPPRDGLLGPLWSPSLRLGKPAPNATSQGIIQRHDFLLLDQKKLHEDRYWWEGDESLADKLNERLPPHVKMVPGFPEFTCPFFQETDQKKLSLASEPQGPQLLDLTCSAGPCVEQLDVNEHLVGRKDHALIEHVANGPQENDELDAAFSRLIDHAKAP
jgi:hypothetical protein